MAKLGISTGTIPNDGTGDTLLDGAIKINSNFNELYTLLGDGATLTSGIVTSIVAGNNVTVSGATGQVTINADSPKNWETTAAGIHTLSNVGIGTTNPTSRLTVTGNGYFTGLVTATSFSGSGSNLTGIVTGITAGANITVLESPTGNFIITSTAAGSAGAGGTWAVTTVGIHTLKNVGIGTTNPTSALTVKGNTSLETLSVSGVSTLGNTVVGGATTQLIVNGDARVTGILTVGASSITLNGTTNQLLVGTGVTLYGNTGIISATKFYGDGSSLSGVVTSGVGITVRDGGGDLGTASVIDFGDNLTVSFASGIATITSSGGGTNVSISDTAPGSPSDGDLWYSSLIGRGFIYYNDGSSSQWVDFAPMGAGATVVSSGGGESYWTQTSSGIHTLSNVGIGTTNPTSDLTVKGNTSLETLSVSGVSTFTGITTVTGPTLFTKQLNVSGVSTFAGITTVTGTTFTNQLSVSGIASVGSAITMYASTGIISATTFYGNVVGNITGSITDATNLTGGYANASQLNVSGIATISQGRIQADASSNLRFGNLAAGSGSGRNIAIGDQVLVSLSGGQGRNIGIGELSYYDTTTGQYNIGIGERAGQKVSTGSYNVVLGAYDGNSGGLDIRTSSRNVVIADGEGNIRQYINSSGNVGIKTTVVTEALTVAGIVSATGFYGTLNAEQLTGSLPAIDGSALIGVQGVGSGVEVQDDTTPVGTAGTINFGTNLNVSFAGGTATISGVSSVSTATTAFNLAGSPNLNVGVVTATSFVGNLTGTASFATVAGIATYTSEWILGAVGSSDYTFTGPGFTGAVSDPVLYLVRGQQYKFTNTMGAHPFRIQSTPNGSAGTQYNDGITNNDVSNGTLTWDVQFDAPGLLYYQCTAHGGMGGKIYIIDAGVGPDISVNTTGIITASSFSGSGSSLTNLPAGQLTGALPALDGSALLNVTASGTGVVVEDDQVNVGSATTIDFGTGLDVTFSAGIATITASGGSLQSRTIVTGVTTSITNNGIGNTNITGFKSYALMRVGLSTAGWLRLYTDSASRDADVSRSVGEDPAPGSGVIAEVVTTGISTTQIISPFVMGGNLDNPADTTIYASIKNLSGSTQAITANLTILQLEA